MYVGSAGVIAVALFIYLGFFAANPTGQDVTGTINSVQKYQTDQISDTDVILAGEEGIIDEMAEFVDHATIEEKSGMLGMASPEMISSVLGRTDTMIKAQLWGNMEKADQVAALNAQNIDKENILGRAEMTLGAFNNMSMEKQAAALQGATVEDKAAMFNNSPLKAKIIALERSDMQGRAAIMQSFATRDKAIIMGRTSPTVRASILERMDKQGRADLVRTASMHSRAYMFAKSAEKDQQVMLQGATTEEKSSLFGSLALKDQIDGTLAYVAMTNDPNLMGRSSPALAQEIFSQVPASMQKELYGRLDKAKQVAISQRVAKADDLGKMSEEKVSEYLQNATAMEKKDILAKATFAEAYGLMSKMNLAAWKYYLNEMKPVEKAEAFGKVDNSIRMVALSRAPGIQADLVGRASDAVAENILGRTFLESYAVK
jgi:hypothetical protein